MIGIALYTYSLKSKMIRQICLQLTILFVLLVSFSHCFNQAHMEQKYTFFTFIRAHDYRRRPTFSNIYSTFSRMRSEIYMVGDAKGEYYGESAGSYMVQEFNTYDQLAEIVKMASLPLPERPDGIVTVVKYTSAATSSENCRSTESEYERLSRKHPSTLFLRCFAEYDDAEILFGQASVIVWPTFDIFYAGNRVARVEGANHMEVEEVLERYQFQNSKLDLFSEGSQTPWGTSRIDYTKTPRTTNRFLPGYDWGSDRGFFDATADKMEQDLMGMYENSWLPKDDDNK